MSQSETHWPAETAEMLQHGTVRLRNAGALDLTTPQHDPVGARSRSDFGN